MSELTDFNDLANERGLEAVAEAINAAVQADPRPPEPVFPDLPEDYDQGGRGDGAETPFEWPEPILPGTAKTPDIPVHEVLTGWLGDYAHHVAKSTQTPGAMSVLCALGVLATVLQRRFEVAPKGGKSFRETLSLWCVSVSPPGTRKTAVLGAFLGPLVRWEKLLSDRMRRDIAKNLTLRNTIQKRIEALTLRCGKADPAELEELRREIEQLQDELPEELRAPRLFTADVTPERLQVMLMEHGESMAVHSDEPGIFGIMGGRYSGGSANLDVFLQGHAGSPMRVDRAGRKAYADRPALSFNLMIQPAIMADVAKGNGFRGSGLLARFLYAMPESNVGRRNVREMHDIPDEVRDDYQAGIEGLLHGLPGEPGAPRPATVLELTDTARELWFDFAQEVEHLQGAGGDLEGISDWTSKLPGTVARIAALIELAEWGLTAEWVSESAMARAIHLARLLIPHAQAAFGLLGADPVDDDAALVLRWLTGNGRAEASQRDIQAALRWRFKNVDKLRDAIHKLKQTGCVMTYQRRNKGAKPTEMVQVNPCLCS